MFHVLLNGTYHEKHLLANVIHERLGPGPLPARGGLTIRTPLSQLLSIDSSYNATSEDNKLQVGAMLDHNNKHKVNISLSGHAESGKHSLNMKIGHSFGSKQEILVTVTI